MIFVRLDRVWKTALLSSALILALLTSAVPVLAAGSVVFSVAGPAQPVSTGSQFTVSINVEPNTAVAGAQFDLTFNPNLVTINSVSEGNLLKQNGAPTYFFPGSIDNASGTLTGVFGVIVSPGQSVSNGGTMANITFTASPTKGTANINLANVIAGDISAQSLPVSLTNGQVSLDTAPVLSHVGNKSVTWNSQLTFVISGSDANSDTLSYSASNLPSGATFAPTSRTFSWTPTSGQSGNYPNVHFQVSDGSLTSSEDITITVNKMTPVFSSLSAPIINYGAGTTILSGTLKAGSQAPSGSVSITLNGVSQNANLNSSGNFSSSFATGSLATTGSPYSVTYAYSGDSNFNSASDISKTLIVNGQAATVTLANLSQTYDGNSKSITTTTGPAGLSVAVTYNGSSTPPSNAGSYNVTGTITSPNYTGTASGTLSVARATPVFSNLSSPAIGYGSGPTNLGGNLKVGSLAAVGSVSITLNGVTQTAALDSSGNFSSNFSTSALSTNGSPYIISYVYAGNGNFNAASNNTNTFRVTNLAPVLASIGNKSMGEGQLLTFTVSATDPEGNSLTYSATNLPSGASFSPTARAFSWTPTHSQIGSYPNVHFQVSDGLLTDSEDITFTIVQVYNSSDVNLDGTVNVLDMSIVGQHWAETGSPGWISADVNKDGVINTLDLIMVGQHWTG